MHGLLFGFLVVCLADMVLLGLSGEWSGALWLIPVCIMAGPIVKAISARSR